MEGRSMDYYCRQFQPNAFDPSRCGACLRPDHMHLDHNNGPQDEDEDALSEVTSSVTSSDVIYRFWTNQESPAHTLSAELLLSICETDTLYSSLDQWQTGRSRSSSPERCFVAGLDMTRLDPSPHRTSVSSVMERGRDRSRRPSVSEPREDRGRESGYFSPDRKGESGAGNTEGEVNRRPYRYYERGHPLPSNHSPEAKACVPYRNVNLGLPSQRRNAETYNLESWRSESPQRYVYHSNFRRGADSLEQSPSRNYSQSPERRYNRRTESPPQAESQCGSSHSRSRAPSHLSSRAPSYAPSHHASGRASPSHRRESVVSRTVSPSRKSPSYRHTDSAHSRNEEVEPAHSGRGRDSRRPSHSRNGHGLDPEKLYRNLDSISRRGSWAVQSNSCDGPPTPRSRAEISSSSHTRARNSRDCSPPKSGYGTSHHSPHREIRSPRETRADTTQLYSPGPSEKHHGDKPTRSPRPGSWQGSSHSLLSPAPSCGHSPPRPDSQLLARSLNTVATTETDNNNKKSPGDRSRSNARRGLEALLTSEPKKAPVEVEDTSMTLEDYVVLADIPRIHMESEEEVVPIFRRRNQSPSPRRDQRFRTPKYQDETDGYNTRVESDDRGRGRERGRDRREREKCRDSEDERLSRTQSSTSIHTQSSDNQNRKSSRQPREKPRVKPQPEPNPTQGWMSKLDEDGQWRRHWFVLGHSALKYYQDTDTEESDDLEGEIDLTTCVNVSDCNLDKNYGIQIHTKRAVFTLSATTSRVRKHWVKALRQTVLRHPSADRHGTNQSDSSSEKENPRCRTSLSCQQPSRLTCEDSISRETATTVSDAAYSRLTDLHRTDSVDQDPDRATPSDLSATQREAGEGWDRDQAKRLEERNKWFEEGVSFGEMGSRWDAMELKRGSAHVPVTQAASEVNRKWAEIEELSSHETIAQSLIGAQTERRTLIGEQSDGIDLSDAQTDRQSPTDAQSNGHNLNGDHMEGPSQNGSQRKPQNLIGAQTNQSTTAETLQKEALSLRQQVESLRKERVAMGIDVESPCGPGAPCGARFEAMEAAHHRALQELQEKHSTEIEELEKDKDRLLQESSQATKQAIEALKRAHEEELAQQVAANGGGGGGAQGEGGRGGGGVGAHTDASHSGLMLQADALHGELDVLSERYSQRCLELSQAKQSSGDRESELGRKERELEKLHRENKELKARLAEEVSRMRYFITGQSSGSVSPGNAVRSPSEMEMLLRAKENEVEYLQKEISCLQDEVQSLTKEKAAAYEQYKEAYVELSNAKSRSQLETGLLKEHLRLANAVLLEGVTDS